MKSLEQFILEKEKSDRSKIVFTIYDENGKVISDIKNDQPYQKINCVYQDGEDWDEKLAIEFLIGFKDGTWQLWAGKPGIVTYADDPYKDLKEDKFINALPFAIDEAEKFVETVKKKPNDWVQFYVNG